MELTKQQVIDKILSFNYEELAEWMKERLNGIDKFFPVFLGHEPNLSEFLLDAFQHIKNEKFRIDFIEILGDLTKQLPGFTRLQIEESKEYISELLFLCGNIKQFRNKDTLLEIAVSGQFKGIEIDETTDLHAELLTTLASFRLAGTCEFWIEQFLDDSNKYYANPAFYALMDNLDILFEYITVFIDKFKGSIELEWGIEALISDYSKKEIVKRFKGIESRLSFEQKKAVNHAFIEIEENSVYEMNMAGDKRLQYTPAPPRLQFVSEPIPQYGTSATLQEKAGNIFKLLGFNVEFNRPIGNFLIDVFIKKKKTFKDKYECWVCFCETGKRKVGKNTIIGSYPIKEAVRNQLKEQQFPCDECEAMVISEKGFTKGAIEMAKTYGFELKTYDQLLSQLKRLPHG